MKLAGLKSSPGKGCDNGMPQDLREQLASLSPEEWSALKVVALQGGQQGITVELAHQIVGLLAGRRRKSSAQALAQLLNRGLIESKSANYRQVFFIPPDLLEELGPILAARMVEDLCPPAGVTVTPHPLGRDLLEDMHRFLAYVTAEEVTLTQHGQIFKRHLRALAQLLAAPLHEESDYTISRYPEPLGFLIDFCLDQLLLQRGDGQLRPTPELQIWAREHETALKQAQLFDFWRNRYYYHDLQAFLTLVAPLGLQWARLDQIVLELEPLIHPSQRSGFPRRLQHHLHTFLAPLGIFELGSFTPPGEEDGTVCRLTPAGAALLQGQTPPPVFRQGQFILQGNYELILPRPADPAVLWFLELCGEAVRADSALQYLISRRSVYRALKAGISGDALLHFLQEHAATDLPQNVAYSLREWVAAYGRVFFQAVCLLRCTDALLAQQIKASRRTGRFVVGELTPTDLVVRQEEVPELSQALVEEGLMPRPGIIGAE